MGDVNCYGTATIPRTLLLLIKRAECSLRPQFHPAALLPFCALAPAHHCAAIYGGWGNFGSGGAHHTREVLFAAYLWGIFAISETPRRVCLCVAIKHRRVVRAQKQGMSCWPPHFLSPLYYSIRHRWQHGPESTQNKTILPYYYFPARRIHSRDKSRPGRRGENAFLSTNGNEF